MEKSFDPVKILLEESKKSILFFIGLDFYKDAAAFLNELERDLKNMDPESTKYALIEDQLKASRNSIETIIYQRLRKIIKQVQVDVLEKGKQASESLTPEELELYNGLLSMVGLWKSQYIDTVLKHSVVQPVKPDIIEDVTPPPIVIVDAPKIADVAPINYVLIRLLQTVPSFVGMDTRTYTLRKEDVVTIPAVNARVLIEKRAAVEIKTSCGNNITNMG